MKEDEIQQMTENAQDLTAPEVIKYPISERLKERLENDYTYHAPKPGQLPKYELIRSSAKSLAYLLAYLCPESRELSCALTHLEETVFYANASISRNE